MRVIAACKLVAVPVLALERIDLFPLSEEKRPISGLSLRIPTASQ